MKTIGIDENNYLMYEGNTHWGHGVWPTPSLLPAYISSFNTSFLPPNVHVDLLNQPFIFLDEGYDPGSRVRKGRIFEKNDIQPTTWNVWPHPALSEPAPSNVRAFTKKLITFRQFNFYARLEQQKISDPCIILGTKDHYTIWSVVDVETSISGETILFIRSRKVIGALPKINYSLIENKEDKEEIEEKIRLLSNDIKNAVPDSVVDRCREAASAVINSYLIAEKHMESRKDLGQLDSMLRTQANKKVVANLASTLALLHSRTKHTEQKSRKTRSVSEQDAELAIQALGTILVELGWGYW